MQCHEVAPCGADPWGDIPVENGTIYVDGSWPGESTGAQDKPWKSIQDAIDDAYAGALIVIAAGNYDEDVNIENHPVRLWGRCPGLVQITGSSIGVEIHTNGTEVHNLSVTSEGTGIWVTADRDTVLEGVWVHDTKGLGIDIFGNPIHPDENAVKIGRSLIEDCSRNGVAVYGSTVRIEESTIRDVLVDPDEGGAAVGAYEDGSDTIPSVVNISQSVIEDNEDNGILAVGSTVHIASTVVRNSVPYPGSTKGVGVAAYTRWGDGDDAVVGIRNSVITGHIGAALTVASSQISVYRSTIRDNDGLGLVAIPDEDTLSTPIVTVDESLVADNQGAGLLVDGGATIVRSTIIRGHSDAAELGYGEGVKITNDKDVSDAFATMVSSVIEDNDHSGVYVKGAGMDMDGSVIRGTGISATAPADEAQGGFGVLASSNEYSSLKPAVTVRRSHIIQNMTAGIYVVGMDLTVEASVIRDTSPNPDDGAHASGIGVIALENIENHQKSSLIMRRSVIENNVGAGMVMIDGSMLVEGTLIRETLGSATSGNGFGIKLGSPTSRLSAQINGSVIEKNKAAGIVANNADVDIHHTVVRDTEPPTLPGDPPSTYYGHGGFGIYLAGISGRSNITTSELSNNHSAGLAVWGGIDVLVDDITVVNTQLSGSDDRFIDCIVVIGQPLPSKVEIHRSTLRNCSRAGIANFGNDVILSSNVIECAAFDLEGHALNGRTFSYVSTGNNGCGCGEDRHECVTQDSNLEPPHALPEE